MNPRRMAPAAVGFAAAAGFLAWSHAYGGRAHEVPALIGWCAAALTLLDLFCQTGLRPAEVLNGLLSGRPLDAESPSAAGAKPASGPAAACAWVAAFVALVALVGFIAAIPAYTLAFMRLQGRLSWRRAAASAGLVTATVWIVFEQLLRYKVFEGVLFGGRF